MQLTVLGTGSVHAAPVPGCECSQCRVTPAAARRKPCSGFVKADGTRLLIDAGGHDLMDRFSALPPEAVLLTHFHPDHVQGLLPWRWAKLRETPAFHPPDAEGCADLFRNPGFLRFRALVAFATVQLERLDAAEIGKPEPAAVKGTVVEGTLAQPGLTVQLLDDKGKQEQPWAGAVLSIHGLGVRGLPPERFAG